MNDLTMKILTAVCFLGVVALAGTAWTIEIQLLMHPRWTSRELGSFLGVLPLTVVSTACLFQFRKNEEI